MSDNKSQLQTQELFRSHNGYLRMSEAIQSGITRYMLYSLRDSGIVEQVSRGVFRLAECPTPGNPDLVIVGLKYPKAVICLLSALAFHDLTTQIPNRVEVALPRKSRRPTLDFPPLSVHRFSRHAYSFGIEEHELDGVPLKIYSPEKTIADCFKFRNKIGMDVVLEALKLYKAAGKPDIAGLLEAAKACRVKNVMLPYLEAIL